MGCCGGGVLVLGEGDSVAVAVRPIAPGPVEALGAGEGPGGSGSASCAEATEEIPAGHKIALRDIAAGSAVLKYGHPIGLATRDIAAGSWVHEHNLRSGLAGRGGYPAAPAPGEDQWSLTGRARAEALLPRPPATFLGYRRSDGSVGTRNELWVIPTVGCVNGSARMVADLAREEFGLEAQALEHPYGCSQLGGDLGATRRLLARLALHPNAAAAVIVSLGCENNRLPEFQEELEALGAGAPGSPDAARRRGAAGDPRLAFLPLQEAGDEAEEARRILKALAGPVSAARRVELPLSELCVGLKCGGSDGFSGITANPLVGKLCDLIVAGGGRAVMTEVPEMFGAEDALMARSASPAVYGAFASMLDSFKEYYVSHGQEIYENPSPGNRDGGITTLEEKSLGCVRKAGSSPVAGILEYGGVATARGLSLVAGPGNDLVSSTALAAAGAQVLLFTTGRGTPFGSVVPTIKLSSNSGLAGRKPGWIDFDAGRLLSGSSFDELAAELLRKVLAVAGGDATRAESGGHRGIAIFKDGVTL